MQYRPCKVVGTRYLTSRSNPKNKNHAPRSTWSKMTPELRMLKFQSRRRQPPIPLVSVPFLPQSRCQKVERKFQWGRAPFSTRRRWSPPREVFADPLLLYEDGSVVHKHAEMCHVVAFEKECVFSGSFKPFVIDSSLAPFAEVSPSPENKASKDPNIPTFLPGRCNGLPISTT